MSAVPMLAGVGLLSVCCISSSVASTMMGGGETIEETKSVETTPVVPTIPKGRYVRFTFHEGAPSKYILAPKEIKVFDKCQRRSHKAREAHSSQCQRFPKENAVASKEDTIWHS